MYVLGVDHVMDMPFNDPQSPIALDLRRHLPPDRGRIQPPQLRRRRYRKLLAAFRGCREAECGRLLALSEADDPKSGKRIIMAHPAYDQCIKASHLFNLLDARGVISVTERQAYIGRVRALAKACADAFVRTGRGRDARAA